MKLIPLAILSAASLTATSTYAHPFFRGYFRFGGPAYCAPVAPVYCPPRPVYVEPPVYCPPPAPACEVPTYVAPAPGYWRDEACNVWVPARWVTSYDAYGCARTYVIPAHYETQMRRVWVPASCN